MTTEQKKEYMKKYNVKYYLKHKTQLDVKANYWRLKRTYGITPEQYDCLLEKQRSCCAICGKHKSSFPNKLYVDHNHLTGQVRGLLCHYCNTGLGNFGDDVKAMRAAIEYVEKYKKEVDNSPVSVMIVP